MSGVDVEARSPRELETMLEDAFLGDEVPAVVELFRPDGVLALGARGPEARGASIARLLTDLRQQDTTYVANPRRIVRAVDTALIVGDHGINVARRLPAQRWRYEIALLAFPRRKEPTDDEIDHN